MAVFSINEDITVSEVYDYSEFYMICDVGGGKGGLINNILSKYPTLRGVILELASTDFTNNNDTQKNDRLTYISGDFFEKIPNADAFILKRVLHNWNNEECIKILTNCLKSLNNPQKGKIFIVEEVLPAIPDGSLLIDGIIIALAFGSIERSLEEFITLCSKAKLNFKQKLPTKEGISVLVFEPA